MKKILWIVMLLWTPLVFAEGSASWQSATGSPTLLDSTILLVDANPGELIVWSGEFGIARCFGPNGVELQATETPAGYGWVADQPGVHEVVLDVPSDIWGVEVFDSNSVVVSGRVFAESWNLQQRENAAVSTTLFIKTATGVVEARLQGLGAFNLFVFATPAAVTQAYRSVPFGSLQGPEGPPQDSFEAWLLINPLYSGMGDVLPIYLNEILPEVDAGDPEIDVDFEECPQDTVSGEASILLNSDSDGIQYTTCLGGGEYRWTKSPIQAGDSEIPWSQIDNTDVPLGDGEFECTTIVFREEIHLPLAGVGTAFEGIRLFRVTDTGERKPIYLRWDDSRIQGVHVGPGGEAIPAESPVVGVFSGDAQAPAEPFVSQGTGNSRAWGRFEPTSAASQAVMNTWGFVYSSEKFDHRVIINAAETLDRCADQGEDMGSEDMGSEDMGFEDMGSEDMGAEDMGAEVPDGEGPTPSFEGTASGGACASVGWGNTSLVIMALFAFVGTLRRRT